MMTIWRKLFGIDLWTNVLLWYMHCNIPPASLEGLNCIDNS